MLVGYARVSSETIRQNTDLQLDALIKAGVDERNIFQDKASGAKTSREGLDKALAFLKPGDCLVVWKLDRLGRSLSHLVQIVTELKERGWHFARLASRIWTPPRQMENYFLAYLLLLLSMSVL